MTQWNLYPALNHLLLPHHARYQDLLPYHRTVHCNIVTCNIVTCPFSPAPNQSHIPVTAIWVMMLAVMKFQISYFLLLTKIDIQEHLSCII